MASRDEKILLKLQKENHDLSLLSTEKKLCQKKNIQVQKKLIQLCSLYMYSILIDENGQFERVSIILSHILVQNCNTEKKEGFFDH